MNKEYTNVMKNSYKLNSKEKSHIKYIGNKSDKSYIKYIDKFNNPK